MDDRSPLPDGFDPVGPFHPYIAFGAVLLLDLLIVLLLLVAITFVGDKVEDVIWPGGREWVEL